MILSSSSISSPVAVRYAWTPFIATAVNLTNDHNLPAAPFRTDEWALPRLAATHPVANTDRYVGPRDQSLSISAGAGLLENDFDINLDLLQCNLVSPTSNGSLTLQPSGAFTYTPEAGFAGQDSFTYQAAEVDGPLTSPIATVSISVEGISSVYYTWRTGIAWNLGDDQTATGDPDGDGISNLLEFALGLDPLLSSGEGLPTLSTTGRSAEYDFNNIQPGITYEVLLSTNLADWSEPAFAILDSDSSRPVSLPTSEGENGRLFVRLRVSETVILPN